MDPQYLRLDLGPHPPAARLPGSLPLPHRRLRSGRPGSGTRPEWLLGPLRFSSIEPTAGLPTRSSLQASAPRIVGIGGGSGGPGMQGCIWDAAETSYGYRMSYQCCRRYSHMLWHDFWSAAHGYMCEGISGRNPCRDGVVMGIVSTRSVVTAYKGVNWANNIYQRNIAWIGWQTCS
jgi:hypothetical protein